jgi:hypothetical protein
LPQTIIIAVTCDTGYKANAIEQARTFFRL